MHHSRVEFAVMVCPRFAHFGAKLFVSHKKKELLKNFFNSLFISDDLNIKYEK